MELGTLGWAEQTEGGNLNMTISQLRKKNPKVVFGRVIVLNTTHLSC